MSDDLGMVLLFRHYKPRYKLNLYRVKAAGFSFSSRNGLRRGYQLRGIRCNDNGMCVVVTPGNLLASVMQVDPVTAT